MFQMTWIDGQALTPKIPACRATTMPHDSELYDFGTQLFATSDPIAVISSGTWLRSTRWPELSEARAVRIAMCDIG